MNRIVALCAVLVSGCTLHVSRPHAPFTESAILLAKDSLDLRLLQPSPRAVKPILILFATGDGGWRGLDQEAFAQIGERGFAVAGFNAGLSQGNE